MRKKQIPFYPFLFAAFPVLALIAYNKFETRFTVIFRPLFLCLTLCLILYVIFYFIFRKNWHKAALMTGTSLLLIFSYGHFFNLLQSIVSPDSILYRHRYVILILGLVWVGVLVLLLFRSIKVEFSKVMNIIGIILIAMPLLTLSWFYIGEAVVSINSNRNQMSENITEVGLDYSPDVYYIILDMYARPDALLQEYGIDVTGFVEDMDALGFYYANESQSNYGETYTSLSTSLNFMLIDEYARENGITHKDPIYRDLLIHSEARALFEELDYQIIAFSTGYRWSELTDADIYYQIKSTNPLSALTPFETLLFKTTIMYPVRGYLFKLLPGVDSETVDVNRTQSLHIETQRNILAVLPEIAQNRNPTFTFAHILIPHPPYIFDEDGTVLDDTGYYSGENGTGINDFYNLDGYTRQVKFISQQILEISEGILADSDNPPIIVIQGDHGWKGDNRQKILNFYYFSDQDYEALYPSITPVNTFRLIFSQYFGMDFELVEDRVILP